MDTKKVRVRFAPSPTGPLHIGGVRTALYNYLFAKQNNGDCILRIEDTDQTRFVPGAEEYIIESLEWCGIQFNEGISKGGPHEPYRQSERKEIYKQYAGQLIRDGKAYYAFDTPEEVEEMRNRLRAAKATNLTYCAASRAGMKNSLSLPADEVEKRLNSGTPYVVRIKIPDDEIVRVTDIIRGEVNVHSSQMDDKVIFKSDGMPTYHLANVVDDYLMKISHVIRGEEWLPSAPLHVLLYKYLGWEKNMPQFAHLPLLLKPEGNGKLSKRDGDRLGFPVFPLRWEDPKSKEISSGYRESGYLPKAFINILAFLGWNPGTEQELYSLEELISSFSLQRVGKSGSKFDPDKAKWFNQEYIKKTNDKILAIELREIIQEKDLGFSDEYLEKVCGLLKERITFIHEIWDNSPYFFIAPTTYDKKAVKKRWKENTPEIIEKLSGYFESLEAFDPLSLEKAFNIFIEKNEINTGAALAPLRLVLTGILSGPAVFDIMSVVGKEESIRRMKEHTIVKSVRL